MKEKYVFSLIFYVGKRTWSGQKRKKQTKLEKR